MNLRPVACASMLGLSLTLLGCPPPNSLRVGGEPREISEVTADLVDDGEGGHTLVLSVLSDPSQRVADDEISVLMEVPIPAASITNDFAVIDLATGGATFDYGCECDTSNEPQPVISGSLSLTLFEDGGTQLSGTLDAVLSGASDSGIDLGEVSLFLRFDTLD